MEEKLKKDMGGSYSLTDDQLKVSHSQHDLDGNGEVTKDEIVWARKLKGRFYADMNKPKVVESAPAKANGGGECTNAVLTDAMSKCFAEDLDLFCSLPPKV